MPPKKRDQPKDIRDAFRQLSESIALQARQPNILAYEPHPKQVDFHSNEADLRVFLGGNRSGKTHAGVVEDIWWLTGRHRYIKTPPPPVRGRLVTVNINEGLLQIILPKIKQLILPSDLINGSWEDSFHKTERILTLDNGSTLSFMTYEMDVEKFAGTSLHFTHYDEEPPLPIFNEAQARLVDTNGRSWMTMTPVEGMTWVFYNIYEPYVLGTNVANRFIVEVDMQDNPHLSPEAIEKFLATLDPEERKAREHGTFVAMSGKVFKNFSKDTHVCEYVDPKTLVKAGWAIYNSIDHGWNNPTAVLWHAVSPNDDVITFGEHYKSEMTIAEHARVIHAMEAEWGISQHIYARTGDPAMKQTSAHTGTSVIEEYSKHGVYIGVESVPRQVEIGIARMQQYFRLGKDNRPKWQIADSCPNLINELQKLRWKTYSSKKVAFDNNKLEQVHKKDDHAFDSARYFATFLPELAPEAPADRPDLYNLPGENANRSYAELLALSIEKEEEREGVWNITESYSYTD